MASSGAAAIIDAGPHGWGRGGHGHADALSLQLIGGSRAWLTDPGTCSYPKEKPERDRFRGTGAHNTLEVDGVSQAEPIHSFAWRNHPRTTVHCWYEGRQVTVFHASHDGYQRLPAPVTHARFVIAWADDLWLVRDVATGQGDHSLDLRWHLAPDGRQAPETVWLSFAATDGWTQREECAPWSPAYGADVSAPVLRLSWKGSLPAECGTLMGCNQPQYVPARKESPEGASAFLYRAGEKVRVTVFAACPGPWHLPGLESDAELLGIEWTGTACTHLFCCGGSFVTLNGNRLHMPPARDGFVEWTPEVPDTAPAALLSLFADTHILRYSGT
jgi:hypothetical protein